MKYRATICCTIQLGSISSLRCLKSRKPRLSRLVGAKRCFRGRLFETNDDQPSGGARRDRTDDLMLAKHALSQLSYGPVTRRRMLHVGRRDASPSRENALDQLVGLGRLELPTSRLSSARSNQLSYKPLTRGARVSCDMRATGFAPEAIARAQPLARVRPRRKRNEDGEIPPMGLNGLATDWPLMFLKRSDSERELSEGSSLERR